MVRCWQRLLTQCELRGPQKVAEVQRGTGCHSCRGRASPEATAALSTHHPLLRSLPHLLILPCWQLLELCPSVLQGPSCVPSVHSSVPSVTQLCPLDGHALNPLLLDSQYSHAQFLTGSCMPRTLWTLSVSHDPPQEHPDLCVCVCGGGWFVTVRKYLSSLSLVFPMGSPMDTVS